MQTVAKLTFNSDQWYNSFQHLDPLLCNDLKRKNGKYKLLQALHDAAPNQNEFIDALSYFICEKEYIPFLVSTLKHQVTKQTLATIFREDSLTLTIFRDVLINKTQIWQRETCTAAKSRLSPADLRVLTDIRNDNYTLLCSFVSGFLDRILRSKLPEDVAEIFRDIADRVSKTLKLSFPEASTIALSNLLILRTTVPCLFYHDASTQQHHPFVQAQKTIQSIFNNQPVSANFPPVVHNLASKYSPLIRAWMETRLRPEDASSLNHVVVFEADLLPEVDYETWDNAQVSLWLTRIDMGKFVSWAQKNEVLGSDLAELGIEDLEDSVASSSEKSALVTQLQLLKSQRNGTLQRSRSLGR